jgi:hypothetical protein
VRADEASAASKFSKRTSSNYCSKNEGHHQRYEHLFLVDIGEASFEAAPALLAHVVLIVVVEDIVRIFFCTCA